PDPAVIAKTLTHQREFGLIVSLDWNAGWMDLRVAGICEVGAALVASPRRGHVAAFRIGREVEGISVPPRAQQHRVRGMSLQFAGRQVAADNTPSDSVNHHQVEHLPAGKDLRLTEGGLSHKGTVG